MYKLIIQGTTEFGNARYQGDEYSPTYVGGNGVIAALSASRLVPVDLISCIGTDMGKKVLKKAVGTGINIDNVTVLEGETFRWKATYDPKEFQLIDQEVSFGVYALYQVPVSREVKVCKTIFFSGSRPQIGLEVLSQLSNPKVIGVNTLFYHLQHNFEASKALLRRATHIFMNEKEYQLITKKLSKELFSSFPNARYLFRKKGKEGVVVMSRNYSQAFQPSIVGVPKDPTNAGDVLAGTIMGYLAKRINLEDNLSNVINEAMNQAFRVIQNDPFYRKEYQSI